MTKVAAIFVQTNGCYFGLENVDPWDQPRDARLYKGPYPVVAHPPCQLWGNMAAVNYKRWGGEHNRPGNDGGCFEYALYCVKTFGGVLEHPKKSKAWQQYGLKKPEGLGWQRSGSGWVCEVWQSAYGHRANKATWLYYRGDGKPAELKWERPIGTHQVGGHDQRGKEKNKPTLGKREANATPLEFREALIALAQNTRLPTPECLCSFDVGHESDCLQMTEPCGNCSAPHMYHPHNPIGDDFEGHVCWHWVPKET
jgi:hypothetical protein